MSPLERRLQLLLEREQYDRVAAEAKRSGKSVNAVIRAAIDMRYPSGVEARGAAIDGLLAGPDDAGTIPADYRDLKRDLEDAMNQPRW